jgi:hypothetical protein
MTDGMSREEMSELIGLSIELGIRELSLLRDQCGSIRSQINLSLKKLREGEVTQRMEVLGVIPELKLKLSLCL